MFRIAVVAVLVFAGAATTFAADANKDNLIGAGVEIFGRAIGRATEEKPSTTTTTLPDYKNDPDAYLPGPLQNEFIKLTCPPDPPGYCASPARAAYSVGVRFPSALWGRTSL